MVIKKVKVEVIESRKNMEYICIGKIVQTHGIKGELRINGPEQGKAQQVIGRKSD